VGREGLRGGGGEGMARVGVVKGGVVRGGGWRRWEGEGGGLIQSQGRQHSGRNREKGGGGF